MAFTVVGLFSKYIAVQSEEPLNLSACQEKLQLIVQFIEFKLFEAVLNRLGSNTSVSCWNTNTILNPISHPFGLNQAPANQTFSFSRLNY